jgi:hypothetical protein
VGDGRGGVVGEVAGVVMVDGLVPAYLCSRCVPAPFFPLFSPSYILSLLLLLSL